MRTRVLGPVGLGDRAHEALVAVADRRGGDVQVPLGDRRRRPARRSTEPGVLQRGGHVGQLVEVAAGPPSCRSGARRRSRARRASRRSGRTPSVPPPISTDCARGRGRGAVKRSGALATRPISSSRGMRTRCPSTSAPALRHKASASSSRNSMPSSSSTRMAVSWMRSSCSGVQHLVERDPALSGGSQRTWTLVRAVAVPRAHPAAPAPRS